MVSVNTNDWANLDPWWEVYAETKQKDLKELQELFQQLQGKWRDSNSRFDQDPLDVDWSEGGAQSGPLGTNQEEYWSDWLGYLFESPPKGFIMELFGSNNGLKPREVKREKCFNMAGETERRADILLFFRDRGISIEVKLGDTHYAKTPHTAHLIEESYELEWTHFLLLPMAYRKNLLDTFGKDMQDQPGARPKICSRRFCDVNVIYWRDVSFALRKTLLLTDKTISPHWEASAYLFIALIEEKLSNTPPKLFIEENVIGEGKTTFSDVLRIKSLDVYQQVSYLSKITKVVT